MTCYNRVQTTLKCLESLYNALLPENIEFDIYLVDDLSPDKTGQIVGSKYKSINIIQGTGSLFWAKGMHLAWETALNSDIDYDGFLLINDDVEFFSSFWGNIFFTHNWCKTQYHTEGIYVLSVKDKNTNERTYGGNILQKRIFKHQTVPVFPSDKIPLQCQLTNANILYVSRSAQKIIGIIDPHFNHAAGDFDYSITACKKNIPVLVCIGYGGFCTHDHNPIQPSTSLKKRVKLLYDVKGNSLNDYIYYLKKHFWWKVPYAFIVLWAKTFFPSIK